MLIRAKDCEQMFMKNMKGGEGIVEKLEYQMNEMPPFAKMFAEVRLEPGCSIGGHQHDGDYEVYYFVGGDLVLNDNGEEKIVHAGDLSICRNGETHSVTNRSSDPAVFFAAVIQEDEN